jgi:putative adhesin
VGTVKAYIQNVNRLKSLRPIGWCSALLVVPMGLALAASPARVEKSLTYQTNLNPRITVYNLEGHVLVRAWDKAQVRALFATSSPRVTFETDPLPVSGSTDKLRLITHVQDPLLSGQDAAADYTLDVPAESSVEIRNRQGLVRIEKLTGDIWIESVGGDVVVSDTAGHLAVRTIGGDIEIIRSAGRVEISSVTGNLHFLSPTSSKLHANTTSGKITYEGDFAPGGDYVFSEYSGEMEIICPVDSAFDVNARSVRGKVFKDHEFSLFTPKQRSSSMPRNANSLRVPGNATLELTSFSGNIKIRHQQ